MRRLTGALFLIVCGLLPAYGAQLETRKSTDAGVTVSVTPQELGAGGWNFKVVLDTHSTDLSDDLVKSSLLVDSRGRKHEPFVWEGAPPGGHHREGVLRFKAVAPPPDWVELRISRSRESEPQAFRWDLK